MTNLDIDAKWLEVRRFYELSYRHLKLSFRARPSDKVIQVLWEEMWKLSKSLDQYYKNTPFLLTRYQRLSGQLIDPTQKRKYSWE